jgi:peptidoglycan/LPS O-acetylase OafA/YrhL
VTDEQPHHPALERLARLEREWEAMAPTPAATGGPAGGSGADGALSWADEPAWSADPAAVLEPTPAAPPRPPQLLSSRPTRLKPERPRMGYQPSLDGVRAVSVIAVILYHAGFEWMHGGFFGVEVFFVVSGFLITSLLVEERDRSRGVIALKQFWQRRFRRLLPALAAVLLAVGVYAALWGTAEQHSQLRHDYPWGIFYLANWGQILSHTPYFGPSPTLLRHLWSLAVEEQWYAIWPVVFIGITRRGGSDRRRGLWLLAVSVAVMAVTAVFAAKDWPSLGDNPSFHVNFLYLSTFSRSSGLLLGAAMAFLWRPWKVAGAPQGKVSNVLDVAAAVAVALLVASFFTGHWDADSTYLWMLPMVSIASAVLVAVVVHPWAVGARRVLGWRPLVEVGKRSYGLYLWSWPVMRVCDAYTGSWPKFAVAIAITVPINEACYRWLEGPIRAGAISRWWANRQSTNWRGIAAMTTVAAVWLMASMTYFFGSATAVYDAAVDTGENLEFDAGAIAAGDTVPDSSPTSTPSSSPDDTIPTESTTPTSTTQPTLPRKLVIVGDSTAHALTINLPDGLETTFVVGNGAISGCSVYSGGTAVSSIGYTRSFGGCGDWVQKWVSSAQEVSAEVALVVIGAWDVFDVKFGDTVVPFGSDQVDQRFLDGLQQGIDALSAIGVKVALLEVPCMRPQDVKGQGTPPLPERADDERVAHVNELLREAATANAATTTFVTGPQEYCTDPEIASSLAYRWDGVHSYKPGAKLTIEAIAAKLLSIPV